MNMLGAVFVFVLGLILGAAGMYGWHLAMDKQVIAQVSKQQGAIEVFKELCPQMIAPFGPARASSGPETKKKP